MQTSIRGKNCRESVRECVDFPLTDLQKRSSLWKAISSSYLFGFVSLLYKTTHRKSEDYACFSLPVITFLGWRYNFAQQDVKFSEFHFNLLDYRVYINIAWNNLAYGFGLVLNIPRDLYLKKGRFHPSINHTIVS